MIRYYKKLKTEKVVNLFSGDADITTNSSGRNSTFTFQLPYTFNNFSKNAEMNVVSVSYDNVDTADDESIFVFRCPEVNGDNVYDSSTGLGQVIYHSRGWSNENDMNMPLFKMIQPLNKLTLSITNSMTDRDNGINTGDVFILTLIIKDYDIEMVKPESMPRIESYHHKPQSRINQY